ALDGASLHTSPRSSLPLGFKPHAVAADWKPFASRNVARSAAGDSAVIVGFDMRLRSKPQVRARSLTVHRSAIHGESVSPFPEHGMLPRPQFHSRWSRMDDRARFEEFARLATEQRNPRTMDLDMLEVPELLARISSEDHTVPAAVAKELPHIARAVDYIVASVKAGGARIYGWPGTRRGVGVLDASECP